MGKGRGGATGAPDTMPNGSTGSQHSSTESTAATVEELQRLVDATEQTLELDRARFARFLHDEISQTLTVLRLNVEALRRRRSADEASAFVLLDEMDAVVQRTAAETRRLIAELRPGMLDQFGLGATLRWLGKDLERQTGIKFDVVDETDGQELGDQVATTLFRIFQDAATNAVRHANARHVAVRLTCEERAVELTVRDDGRGIADDAARGATGVGLIAMRERARALGGESSIRRLPNGGTAVVIRVPFEGARSGGPAS